MDSMLNKIIEFAQWRTLKASKDSENIAGRPRERDREGRRNKVRRQRMMDL